MVGLSALIGFVIQFLGRCPRLGCVAPLALLEAAGAKLFFGLDSHCPCEGERMGVR